MQFSHREQLPPSHSRLRFFVAASAAIASLSLGSCSPPAPERARVYPNAAADLQPIRLSDLIYSLLPDNKSQGWEWDSINDPHLQWLPNGLEYQPEQTHRDALARIRTDGDQTSWVLRDKWIESAWTISLSTKNNPGMGPNQITILPEAPNDECRGAGHKGCTYDLKEVESSSRYRVSMKCQTGQPGRQSAVMMLIAPGKQLTYLSYATDGGSLGDSTVVELSADAPECSAS